MAQSSKTVLGPASYFVGQLKSDEEVHVDGILEGPLQTSGNLTVAVGAEVRGPVRANDIVLDGMVIGDVHASGLLTIGPGGRLVGDIRAAGLRIHDGGSFTGHVEMLGDSSAIPPVSSPTDLLTTEPPPDPDDDPAAVTDEGPPAWDSDQHRQAEANVRVESSTLDPPEAQGMLPQEQPHHSLLLGDDDDTEDDDVAEAPPIHETDDLPELLLPGQGTRSKPRSRPLPRRKRNS